MLRVVGCITQDHDPGLIVLACLVCLLATNASTRLLGPRRGGEPALRTVRLGAAVLAFSIGVWTTHFISLLAYRPGLPLAVDAPQCALSLALAIGIAALGFAPYPRGWPTPRGASDFPIVAFRGFVLAAGIGAMHFAGMRSVRVPGVIHSQPDLVVAALALGALCAICAMWLLARRRPHLAGVLLTLAVASTHFIAMGSVSLENVAGPEVRSLGLSRPSLALVTGAACVLILALALGASILDQRLSDRLAKDASRFRVLADATFEGLVFEHAGRVSDVNRAMCRLAGSEAATLIGLRLVDLIPGLILTPEPDETPKEHVVLLPDGETKPVEVLWRDDLGHGGHVVAIRDLSRQKAAESQIDRLARFDTLTGLANRDMFEQQLEKAIALSGQGKASVALHYIDVDRFEELSETLGPKTAQQILIQTAQRLSGVVRDNDTVARLGRDEFAIVQTLAKRPADAAALADRIAAEMAVPLSLDGQQIALTVNLGIALYPDDGHAAADLIKNAALARREAKNGGHRWRYFEPLMDLKLQARRAMEQDLRIALNAGQFGLHYQPFVAIGSQQLAGYEALLRWDHPERGRIPPAEFIPLAEACGLIVPIGNWVLATACAEAASWNDPVTISVNLSPAQFGEPGLVAAVAEVLRRTGLPPARLELEITEGVLMDDTQNALRILTALKVLGVKIAMDDFGTGYSSLSYLRKFPFDKIKIDRSFISDVGDDIEAATIVQAIIALGRSLRLVVTAEGVETRDQLALLRSQGCTFAQGYLLGRPHPAHQLGQHISREWAVFGNDPMVAPADSA
ncbi:MAG TPA: EAL domain-containing protein [Rhodopila sp.]